MANAYDKLAFVRDRAPALMAALIARDDIRWDDLARTACDHAEALYDELSRRSRERDLKAD